MRKALTALLTLVTLAWIGYTLYVVSRYGSTVVVDPDTTSRIMAVRNGDRIESAIGLTYHGLGGAVLVVLEVLLILAALAAGLFATGWLRRVGLVTLVAWTALWLANAIWLQSIGWDRPRDVTLIGSAMLATVVWAGFRALARPSPSAA